VVVVVVFVVVVAVAAVVIDEVVVVVDQIIFVQVKQDFPHNEEKEAKLNNKFGVNIFSHYSIFFLEKEAI
jgi:hypothetical protein